MEKDVGFKLFSDKNFKEMSDVASKVAESAKEKELKKKKKLADKIAKEKEKTEFLDKVEGYATLESLGPDEVLLEG